MYQLKTEADFDSAHFLSGYTGKCSNIHGHRWHVEIEIESRKLEKNGQGRGMLVDFGDLKKDLRELADSMDHTLIYEENTLRPKTLEALDEEGFHLVKVPFRPTAENFSEYFFRKMEEKGMYGFVGKVNMDCNSPEFLIETTEDSLRETEIYLDSHTGSGKVKPILAPRFAPTCSEKLMIGLGMLAAKYHCGVHTHLVESIWEAEEALRCFPGYHSDAEIYERAGLMDHGPSIFAHVIFPTEEDKRIMKEHGSFSVHCPDATTNIIAGIMPLAAMHDEELKIAIGSDVAGGHSIAIYKQIARAVQLSKLKEFYEPDQSQTITLTQAFYHATKEAGSVFGKVGSFEKGYQFNALVIDTMEDSWVPLTPEERLERFCYIGDDRNIRARFIDGEEIHFEN